MRNLAIAGIKVVCCDFMPVFDWRRTQSDKRLPDGSTTLVFYWEDYEKIDPIATDFALCDWETVYSSNELRRLFLLYRAVGEEKLWENLTYF